MATNLEDKVRELEAKVVELYDREALRDLRFRYHECINEAQTAGIPALFSEDGELEFGHLGRAKGREQIQKFFGGIGRARTSDASNLRGLYRVRQFIHNHVVKINGDRAEGYAYLEAKPVYNGESYVVAARYNDEYVKRDGQWLFSKMSLTPFFMVPLKEGWAGDDLLKMGR
ncbi:MAG TPA: nuclear transport factor 2 family protein [Candidatus Binataceae bacterium]|nr:nuclear transport factor 2 family protein [Candidatus Binataceae bacterium]